MVKLVGNLAGVLAAGFLVALAAQGAAQEVDKPTPPPSKVEWRDGKTRITTSGAYLEISNRFQSRWTEELPGDSITLPGTAGPGEEKGSFRIRRAKLKIEGWFHRPELECEIQVNWMDVSGSPASRLVEDANVDWDVSRKKKLRIRLGQFKAPYGRQQITSSGSQQFVDRAITDARYSPGRETGLALWGTLGGTKLDWRLMVSNGNGRSQTANDNARYMFTGRVQWQALGGARMNQWGSGPLLTEGDLGDSGGKPLLALAAGFLRNDRTNATANVDLRDTQLAGDFCFKYRGFASVGEYHHRRSRPETGDAFEDEGFLLQASYAWKAPGPAGYWEVAARYATLDPSDLKIGDDRTEIGGGLGYYHNKHNIKVQADLLQVEDQAGAGNKSQEIRLQAQLTF